MPRWSRAGVVARGENRGKADRLKTFLLALSSQLRPGETVRFARISLQEAEITYHRKQSELDEWVTRLLETSVSG